MNMFYLEKKILKSFQLAVNETNWFMLKAQIKVCLRENNH